MGSRKGRLAKLFSIPVLLVAGFLVATTMAGVGLANGTTTDPGTTTIETTTTTTVPGGEGCTPGFWKNHAPEAWAGTGYASGTLFSSVFESAFPGQTLLQVLNNGGGGLNALGRHTVAALLNAASPNVDYDLTAAQVIAAFNAVFPGGNYEALKNVFEGFNQQETPGFCD